MNRASTRQIAALVRVMRVVCARIGQSPPAVTDALDRVDAWARGEKVAKSALERAVAAVHAAGERAEKVPAWAYDAVAKVAWMAAKGEDLGEVTLTHAAYGWLDPSVDALARHRAVEALYAQALAELTSVSDSPIARPVRKIDPRAARLLAAARKKLGRAGVRLDRLGAERDPKLVVPRAQLEKLLARKKYPAHAAVIAFDRDFGGLLLPSEADEDWRAHGDYTIVGSFACLKSGAHAAPRGGPGQAALALVPILFGPPDTAVYLDARGRAYVQDLVGDVDATPYARDGRAALIKTIDWSLRERRQ